MALVYYVTHDNSEFEVDVPAGSTVMDGALNNGIEGILAECGGAMCCATCHVYVDDAWMDKVAPASNMETEMLEVVSEPKDNSRLCCQLTLSDDLDGLKVHIPESQF